MNAAKLDEALQLAVAVFLDLLRHQWHAVRALASAVEHSDEDAFVGDWAQANWENVVEAAVASYAAPTRIFLEPYGDGADCNGEGSRVWVPNARATHVVRRRPRVRSEVWDVLMGKDVEVLEGGLAVDRFATTTSNGWYAEAPPFDHVLAFHADREVLFRLADVTLTLRQTEP